MDVYPLKLKRLGDDRLQIEWSDGETYEYNNRKLRKACPCAHCQGEDLPIPLNPKETSSDDSGDSNGSSLKIITMKPVGNYGYAIDFSDGHSTGIYTFQHLREVGERV